MKHVAAGAIALSIFGSTSAMAGNTTPAMMEQAIVVEEAKAGSSSSAMVFVALTGLFMFAVVAQ